jgi:hypothetical protein
MWKQILDFDMHVSAAVATPVKEIVAGKTFHRPLGGFVAVTNVGMDANWLGHPLAMANLYGFGRLAWNPNLSSATIAEEWTRLTFGNDPLVVRTISGMELASWGIYESYTGPLGAGTLTDITGPHYGPGVESSERNGWGQWHRADHEGVGMDRTMASGTGYIGQYSPAVQQLYETLGRCPDELLLFMHHVPYTYVLHSGKTVIQHIYDSHYEGAEKAAELVRQWKTLAGRIDEDRYSDVQRRLEYQAGHAIVWRDAVNNWFFHISGIADEKGRVGNDPDRLCSLLTSVYPFDAHRPNSWRRQLEHHSVRGTAAAYDRSIEATLLIPHQSCLGTSVNRPFGEVIQHRFIAACVHLEHGSPADSATIQSSAIQVALRIPHQPRIGICAVPWNSGKTVEYGFVPYLIHLEYCSAPEISAGTRPS